MRRTVDYITDPAFNEDVGVVDDGVDWRDVLEPGDIILCRFDKGWMAPIIKNLDGWFTHATVYVGFGEVAHSTRAGVIRWPIEKLEAVYSSVAYARPRYRAANAKAATWANRLAEPDDSGEPTPYGARELGQAFAVLARARAYPSRKDLPPLEDDQVEALLQVAREDSDTTRADRPSTCAGFVWRAYAEGADRHIEPAILEGVIVDEGLMRMADDAPSLATRLMPEEPALQNPGSDGSGGDLRGHEGRLAWEAISTGLAGFFRPSEGAFLSNAVSPGDLWCSPSMGARAHLRPRYADLVEDEGAHEG